MTSRLAARCVPAFACLTIAALAAGCGQGRRSSPTTEAPPERGGDVSFQGKPARAWVEQLKDKDVDTRLAAARALRGLGAGARPWAAQLEAALKDASWELVLLIPEAGKNASATFQFVGTTVGSTSGVRPPPSPEELAARERARRRLEEERQRAEQERRRFQKRADYLIALVEALQKADPDRLAALGLPGEAARRFVDELSDRPRPTATFQKIGTTIAPPK
jgi:hypothetical protein